MESGGMWLAAAPVAITVILLTPLPGKPGLRGRLPWAGSVAVLLSISTFYGYCSVRTAAVQEVEDRLFVGPTDTISVYDATARRWLYIGSGDLTEPPTEVGYLAAKTRDRAEDKPGGVSASPLPLDSVKIALKGNSEEVEKLRAGLELLANSRYGSAVLRSTLAREDVTISFVEEIGVRAPWGHHLTTGGTAMTVGKQVYLSRERYAHRSPAVVAAMQAHELTHVAQNLEAGEAWWQWPWTTVDREVTAHLLQAIVWAEVRGDERDWEQDFNLQAATDRDWLRWWILQNPAYPRWLAPNLSC